MGWDGIYKNPPTPLYFTFLTADDPGSVFRPGCCSTCDYPTRGLFLAIAVRCGTHLSLRTRPIRSISVLDGGGRGRGEELRWDRRTFHGVEFQPEVLDISHHLHILVLRMSGDAESGQIPGVETLAGFLGRVKAAEIDGFVFFFGLDDHGAAWMSGISPAKALFGVDEDAISHCNVV